MERESSDTKYSLACIDGRRWNSKESAGKAANKKNKREKGGERKWRKE